MKTWLQHRKIELPDVGFGLRLFMTLVLTLCATGAFQYITASRDTRQRLLDEASLRAEADTVLVQQAFDSETNVSQRTDLINKRLQVIGKRSGVKSVLLVDRFGIVNNASDEKLISTYHGDTRAEEVIQSGRVSVSINRDGEESYYRYRVPVQISTGTFVLEVDQSEQTVEDEIAAAKRSSLFLTCLGVGIGGILFFLFGGRSLSRMHHKAQQMSSRDGLTDLENHITFKEALEQMTQVAQRTSGPLSLALIDVDDFKLVNDRLGHRQGDEVIKKVASLLKTGRRGDRAFRVGGDEFAVLLPGTSVEGARPAIERMWANAVENLGGVTLSIGVASFEDGMTHTDFQDRTDHALYEAKRRGRNGVIAFEEIEGESVIPSSKMDAVRRIIADGVMNVAFQPIWKLNSNTPLGFETLARPLPEYGLNGPGELFHIAEMIGRTAELDVLAWTVALKDARDLDSDTLLFLNMSPFTADKGDEPIDKLIAVVAASNRKPSNIVVEITERFSQRRDLIIEQAKRLKQAGFLIALDDVGAGHGDLEMMASVRADYIKIDLAIVQRAVYDTTARGVFFAIAEFASHTDSIVIAEGIEDESILEFVERAGEHSSSGLRPQAVQGYLLGRPAPGDPIQMPLPFKMRDEIANL